jgi:hypothetical protein
LVKLIITSYPGTSLRIPIFTDNQGNAFSMMSGRAKKLPNSAILCELMMTLYRAEATIWPAFIMREYNQCSRSWLVSQVTSPTWRSSSSSTAGAADDRDDDTGFSFTVGDTQ